MLDPTCTVGQAALVGFWMTRPPGGEAGGVLRGASPDALGGWLAMCCLFEYEWPEGAGFCPESVAIAAPGRNRLAVIVLRTTISSSPCSASAFEEFTDLVAT